MFGGVPGLTMGDRACEYVIGKILNSENIFFLLGAWPDLKFKCDKKVK